MHLLKTQSVARLHTLQTCQSSIQGVLHTLLSTYGPQHNRMWRCAGMMHFTMMTASSYRAAWCRCS